MSSTDPTAPIDTLNASQALARLEELRTSGRHTRTRATLYIVSVCYGVIAWLQGSDFLIIYLGVLVVMFSMLGLQDAHMRRIQVQIDLLVKLLRDEQEKRDVQARVA